jgi:LCP family protein required for cell wall assembly
MLSIPRDLWVDIPGMVRPNKINTAHRFGELYHLPGGGPGLAMRTVENLLGIPLHYFVRVDFRAFERLIDELGGVELDVPSAIKVDPTGPGNTVVLKPGKQTLDGPTALAYARNRYTSGGDFDRARRQQQVILAIRDRVLRLDMLPKLVGRAPQLYETLSSGIQSNLTLQRAIQLAWLSREIDSEDIRTGLISSKELIAGTSEGGSAVYLPNPDRIRALVNSLFPGSTPALSLQEGMLSEEARISIVDQSGIPERAERVAHYLEAQGFQIMETTVSEERAEVTHLIDYTGKPYTMRYLAMLMGATTAQIDTDYTPGSKADIVILLGTDWIYRKLD